MGRQVEVRRFRRGDEADAIRLLVEKLPEQEREAAFEKRTIRWQWQYYDNPNNPGDEPLIWVAEAGGRLGGMVATVPVSLRTPKGRVLGMWGVDFVVDSTMRGAGIGKSLLVAWLKTPGVAFVRGWSPVSFRVATGVGFKLVWGFTSATVALSRLRYGTMLLRTSQRRDLTRLLKVCALPNRGYKARSFAVRVSTELPSGAGELGREVARSYPFAVERDEEYLRWRFLNHPNHTYRFVGLEEGGTMAGLAVVRVTDQDPPMGIMSDLLADPKRKQVVLSLVAETLDYLKSQGACAALMDLPAALTPEVVARYPCSVKKEFGMIVHTSDEGLLEAGIFDLGSWLQSRSDSDEDY